SLCLVAAHRIAPDCERNMYADYTRLEAALRRLLAAGKPTKGVLGYTVGGVYSVAVPNDDARYYVRFPDGSFAAVAHRGRVAPVPDLPVEVGFDGAGNQVILGGDPDRPGDL